MKVSPKKEYSNLTNDQYDVLAVNSGAVEFYLIQNEYHEFGWIESQYFDKRTLENKELLVREELSEYHHYLLLEHLNLENRKFKGSIEWGLQGHELYEEILFLQNMKLNGYELTKDKNELLKNSNYQYSLIKEQINNLSKTMTILSDGYFPTLISIDKIRINNIISDYTKTFLRSFEQSEVNLEYSINEVDNLEKCLNETFEWSYNWLKGFNVCTKIFEDSFWNNQLLSMINIAVRNLFVYSKINDQKVTIFYFKQGDGSEVKFITFETDEFKTILRIDNVVH